MTPSQRAELVLFYEGQALQVAGRANVALGAEHTRCVIDGSINALIRLEGSEAAAEYAFAAADRAVGRLRLPTELFPKPVERAEPTAPAPAPAPAPAQVPMPAAAKPMRFWSILLVGWAVRLSRGNWRALMTVYVDNARISYRNMIMCHMVGDDLEELHLLACAIGLKRKYFHRGHYNICLAKRAEAVRLGATQITMREAVELRRRLEQETAK